MLLPYVCLCCVFVLPCRDAPLFYVALLCLCVFVGPVNIVLFVCVVVVVVVVCVLRVVCLMCLC